MEMLIGVQKSMKLSQKLSIYFEETGVQKNWFARKIGLEPKLFYQILSGHRALPLEYWRPIINWTNGKITLKDLVEDSLRDSEGLELFGTEDKLGCHVSLKELNTTT